MAAGDTLGLQENFEPVVALQCLEGEQANATQCCPQHAKGIDGASSLLKVEFIEYRQDSVSNATKHLPRWIYGAHKLPSV